MGQFAGGIGGSPAAGAQLLIGLSLAMPNRVVAAELEQLHPAGVPYAGLILISHQGECRSILTRDLAVVLLGSLEEFWDQAVAGLPVDQVDQAHALRVDARRRFAAVYGTAKDS